jgi:hypothetical protein
MNRTVLLGLFVFSVLVVCNCSDYFTPWTAFQQPNLDPGSLPPEMPGLRTLNIGDSIGPAFVGPDKKNWYAIPAKKDSTYVLALYEQVDLEYMVIKAGDFSVVTSGLGRTYFGYRPVVWMSDTSDTEYVRISATYSYDSGSYCLTLKTFQTVFGNSIDSLEPDARTRTQQIYPFMSGDPEFFTIRSLSPGDTDWFYFTSFSSDNYIIRTVGNTDTKICLQSATGETVIASDDNSGGALNARLAVPPLDAIRYFFVTGGTAAASGAYGVSIKYSNN